MLRYRRLPQPEQNLELTYGLFALRKNAEKHQPAFKRQRFEKTTGALCIADHALKLVGTRADIQMLQFHTCTNKFVTRA